MGSSGGQSGVTGPDLIIDGQPGRTDDARLAAAIAEFRSGYFRSIRGTPGKQYAWANPLPAEDFALGCPLRINLRGCQVTYNGPAPGWEIFASSESDVTRRSLELVGGEYIVPNADHFLYVHDVTNVIVRGAKFKVTNGAFINQVNTTVGGTGAGGWCERNQYRDLDDLQSQEIIRLSSLAGAQHSHKALVLDNIRTQGGKAGVAKINILDSPVSVSWYDGVIRGIRGNLAQDAVMMRLAGSGRGTKISELGIEAPGAGTAHYFAVGAMDFTNGRAVCPDLPALGSDRMSLWYPAAPTPANYPFALPTRPGNPVALLADDAPIQSNVTPADDATLVIMLDPSTTYVLDGVIFFNSDATTDLLLGFDTPTGSTGYWLGTGPNASIAQSTLTAAVQLSRFAITSNGAFGGVGAVIGIRIGGLITTPATIDKPLAVRWAQNTSGAINTNLSAGSWLRADPVGG